MKENLQANRIGLVERKIKQLYFALIRDVSQSAGMEKYLNKPFDIRDYPLTQKKIEKGIRNLTNEIVSVINRATEKEWNYAVKANNSAIKSLLTNVPAELKSIYTSNNMDALKAFQTRKAGGLTLSERVWRYAKEYKGELELGLDIGIAEGKSADTLAKDLMKYLKEPEKLFRRVRDERGELVLSQNAKKYQQGRGSYKSSYKNAMRMTRTEISMAYRASDYEKNKSIDFVVGYEVHRSNHVYPCPLCDSLKGKYPKEFKFVGWHSQCRCFTTSILSTEDEFIEWVKKRGTSEETPITSQNEIKELPNNFTSWVKENQERIDNAKSKPYFIIDNQQFAKVAVDSKFNATLIESEIKADNLLRSKAGEVWINASEDERKAIYYYTLNEYSNINYVLRTELRHRDQSSLDVANLISRSKYDVDVVLRRGCKPDDLKVFGLSESDLANLEELKKKAIGRKGVYENFVSTGAASGKGMNRAIEYHIQAPRGTQMIYTEPFSGNGEGFELKWDGKAKQKTFSNEQEVLINQGYEFEIINVEKYVSPKGIEVTRFIIRALTRNRTKVKAAK